MGKMSQNIVKENESVLLICSKSISQSIKRYFRLMPELISNYLYIYILQCLQNTAGSCKNGSNAAFCFCKHDLVEKL